MHELEHRGLRVGVAVGGTAEDLRGRADLGFGRLQDGGPGRSRPWRERLAQVPVVGILGRDGQALPFGERARERAVPGDQVFDPRAGSGVGCPTVTVSSSRWPWVAAGVRPSAAAGDKLLADHLKFLLTLQDENTFLAAGPLDLNVERIEGMCIV